EVLEAPAAGQAGGGGGDGSSFVRLERIGEELGTVSYAFPLEARQAPDAIEDPLLIETADAPEPLPVELSATITIDPIAEDDVINSAEADGNITITGTVGGDAKAGDTVTLTVGGTDYTGTVAADLTYAIDVPGSVLVDNSAVDANVSGSDAAGNAYSADANRPYGLDLRSEEHT